MRSVETFGTKLPTLSSNGECNETKAGRARNLRSPDHFQALGRQGGLSGAGR